MDISSDTASFSRPSIVLARSKGSRNGTPFTPSVVARSLSLDRVARRDWCLTMLTDAQVAAQAFNFRAETRLASRRRPSRSLTPSKSKTAERAMHLPKLWR